MEAHTTEQNGITVIALMGSLDAMTAEEAQSAIQKQLNKEHVNLVINLDGLEFLSSAGMRVLLSSLQTVRTKGGDLRLAGGSDNIKRTLNFSGFTKIMKSYDTTAAAVDSYQE